MVTLHGTLQSNWLPLHAAWCTPDFTGTVRRQLTGIAVTSMDGLGFVSGVGLAYNLARMVLVFGASAVSCTGMALPGLRHSSTSPRLVSQARRALLGVATPQWHFFTQLLRRGRVTLRSAGLLGDGAVSVAFAAGGGHSLQDFADRLLSGRLSALSGRHFCNVGAEPGPGYNPLERRTKWCFEEF